MISGTAKTLVVFCAIFVLCQAATAQTSAQADSAKSDKLILVHADVLKGYTLDHQKVRQLIGNVKFRQGSAVLTCDRASQYVTMNKTILSGDVAFVDTSRQLYGDQIIYFDKLKRALVEGHVKLVDSTKTLFSQKLDYFDEEEKAVADNEVVLIDSTENITITGEHAEYLSKKKYALVTGNPVMTKRDTSGADTLIIYGDIFEMFDDGDRFDVTGKVKVERGDITAFCDTLRYLANENQIILRDSPRIREKDQYLTGKTVTLFLKDAEVERIYIVGNAIASSTVDSTIKTSVPYDLLKGEEMMVYVTNEAIDSVRISKRATSYYHVIEEGQEKGLNKALGDELVIIFGKDKLKRVRVHSSPSTSTGEFYPPKDQMVLEKELKQELEKLGIKLESVI